MVIDAMASEMPDVAFCKVDVDVNRQVAQTYRIESMPTFIFLRHGTVLNRFSGADPNTLMQTLNNLRLNAFDVIPAGTKVRVYGLTGAPQHNGLVGTVKSYQPNKGRYIIKGKLNSDEERELSLKRSNVLQLLEVKTVEGDQVYTIDNTAGDAGARLFNLASSDGSSITVPSDDFILPSGTRCEITGLVGAAQFNGKVGHILNYSADTGRYTIQVAMNKNLKVKRQNVIL